MDEGKPELPSERNSEPRDTLVEMAEEGEHSSAHSDGEGEEELPATHGRIYEYAWEATTEGDVENPGIYSLAALGPAGRLVAVGGDERVHVLQLSTETTIGGEGLLEGVIDEVAHQQGLEPVHHDSLSVVAVADDKTVVAVGSLDGKVSVYDAAADGLLKLSGVFEDASADIEALVFAPNSKVLLATTADGQAYVWHTSRGLASCFAGHKGRVPLGTFATLRKRVVCVTAGADGHLCVWNPETGASVGRIRVVDVDSALTAEQISNPDQPSGITALDLMPDSPVVLVGCADGTVALVNYESEQVIKRFPAVSGVVETVKFAPSHSRALYGDLYFAVGDSDGNLCFATVSHDRWRHKLTFDSGTGAAVIHILWSASETQCKLVAAGTDGAIRIFDCRSGECLDCLTGAESICDLKLFNWSGDLPCIVAGTEEGKVLLWQLD